MPSTLPPRSVVCENPNCFYNGQLRQIHPIRIGIEIFTYPPAYCGCDSKVEMRMVRPPDEEDAVEPMTDEELVAEARSRGYRVLGRSEPVMVDVTGMGELPGTSYLPGGPVRAPR